MAKSENLSPDEGRIVESYGWLKAQAPRKKRRSPGDNPVQCAIILVFFPYNHRQRMVENYFFNKKTKSDLNIAVHAVNGRGAIDYEPKIL